MNRNARKSIYQRRNATARRSKASQVVEHSLIMRNATISRFNQAINNEFLLNETFTKMQTHMVDGFAAKGIKIR